MIEIKYQPESKKRLSYFRRQREGKKVVWGAFKTKLASISFDKLFFFSIYFLSQIVYTYKQLNLSPLRFNSCLLLKDDKFLYV